MPAKTLSVVTLIAWLLTCCVSASPKPHAGYNPLVSLDTVLSCAQDSLIEQILNTNLAAMRRLADATRRLQSHSDDDSNGSVLIRDAGFTASATTNNTYLDFLLKPNKTRTTDFSATGSYCTDALWATEYPSRSDKALPSGVVLDQTNFSFDTNTVFLRASEFTFKYVGNPSEHYFSAKKGRVTLALCQLLVCSSSEWLSLNQRIEAWPLVIARGSPITKRRIF